MDTIVRPPSAPPGVSPVSRRRRWPWVLLSAGVVLLFIAVLAVPVYLDHYKPLTGFTTGASGVLSRDLVIRTESVYPPDSEDFTQYRIHWLPGSELSITFTMRNEGPIPVEVMSIGDHPSRFAPYHLLRVRMGPEPLTGGTVTPLGFEPFTLDNGAARQIEVVYSIDRALDPGECVVLQSVEVRFKVLFGSHMQFVPMPLSVVAGPC